MGTAPVRKREPAAGRDRRLMEVRAGFSTPAQQIARRGYDPREVVEEWQKYAALFDQLGLIFDADPRRVSRAGLAQAVDATDRAPPPEER